MAYSWTDSVVGPTPAANVDDVQKFAIGTRLKARDPLYGEGEFVYLPGVASCAVGSVVAYNTQASSGTGSTTLAVAATRGPLAVAMAAVIAGNWGWFQVRGAAVVATAGATVADTPAYLTATAGAVDDAVTAGQGVDGMVFKTAAGGAGTCVAQIADPSASGAF